MVAGKLCDRNFMRQASLEDVQGEIERGGDINARDEKGKTALHHATYRNRPPAIAELLLEKGVDINAKDRFGGTALHDAVFWDNSAVAELLRSRGGKE